jgi:uncharacterized protein
MSQPLPDLLDPWKAAHSGAVYEGETPLAPMTRLQVLLDPAAAVAGDEAAADTLRRAGYHLEFGRDGEGRAVVAGSVTGVLPLRCQRCFEGFGLAVDARVCLALVSGLDEAKLLPDAYDPLLVEDRLLRGRDLIEDELILAVPPVPRHPHGGCEMPAGGESGGSDDGAAERGERPNPFAVLASLKKER